MNYKFKGGIQAGTNAFDENSKRLDESAKTARDSLVYSFPSLKMVKTFPREMKLDLVGDDCFGFSPDGGAWFESKGKLVAVFECKKQGKVGNAYERWWDNAVTAKHINKDVMYLTFCSGEGAMEGECLDKLRRKAKIMMGENFLFEMSLSGFAYEEVENKMKEVLRRFA